MQPLTLTGLIANDVRTTGRDRYLQLAALLEAELRPQGTFEVLLVAEILRANWRLQRYAQADETADTESDRTALDRARSHAHTTIRRNIAELRRLQTDREVESDLGLDLPRLVNLKDFLKLSEAPNPRKAQADSEKEIRKNEPNPVDVAHMESQIYDAIVREQTDQLKTAPQEMKIRTQTPPRNALCGCGSGQKYKRCCGHWSKSPLPQAA